MNEIEKMYELANVETLLYCCDGTHGEPTKKCKGCLDYREVYPPFTAEKQIELIKWLVKNQDIFKITYHREFLWCSSIEWVESDCYEEFEESLASLINSLWQDLTEEERKQIEEILE